MKKIIVSIVYFVLFSFTLYAQNDCFTLNSTQITELERAENGDDYNALQELGLHYFQASEKTSNAEEKQINLLKALGYFQKAYSSIVQNESSFGKIAYYYGLASYRNKDFDLAFKYIKESVDKGYFSAQFYLAEFYEKGVGTEVNNEKAVKYYTPVALRFNPYQAIACDRLGRLYHYKLKDSNKAAQWLIKAVNLGYTRATYLLLNIDDKYAKDIAIYDENTQRAKGYKFNKDGEWYSSNCNGITVSSYFKNKSKKRKHSLNPKTVSEKQDPVFPITYYKKREQIDFAKRSILESIGGKHITFSSGHSPFYSPSLIKDDPLLKEAYYFVKESKIDKIYQIKKSVKSSYSFYRMYINEAENTFYVFVIETKSLKNGYYMHKLIQLGKVGLYEFELYTTNDKLYRTYDYPVQNIPWYFIADNIKNHTHYKKD